MSCSTQDHKLPICPLLWVFAVEVLILTSIVLLVHREDSIGVQAAISYILFAILRMTTQFWFISKKRNTVKI